ncbi:patatin family protein [uncultured Bacteroides sp.]|uniref:patatin-like phospholipase family protein n=1 Tax=uncultured Bacteroides sp. TaxID=162156 RepID=UPI00280A956A|nr:patatin family protein [uncultured Bacteroides sp.]
MKLDFEKTGLVLEGGGMRGVFTCGVLDFMMDRHLEFPYVIGVSAGACNGLSYMSHQRGRAKFSNIDMMAQYHYIGLKYLWYQHSILDQHLLYDLFPSQIAPFDYEAYFNNPARFEMVTTNCVTGRACYLEEKKERDRVRLVDIAKASSSLPYVCPIAYVDGRPMLDGGIVDSIPVLRAISQGYERNVVVLTRNRGYRKSEKDIRVPRFIYRRYPRLRLVLSKRCAAYNEQLDLVEKLEDEGRIIVIRPEKKVVVNRIEKDVKKLSDLYEEGYACAEKVLLPFLEEETK